MTPVNPPSHLAQENQGSALTHRYGDLFEAAGFFFLCQKWCASPKFLGSRNRCFWLARNLEKNWTYKRPTLSSSKLKMWRMKHPKSLTDNIYLGVSKNHGTPKSSILIGFSIINHPFWGTPIFGNTHLAKRSSWTAWRALCFCMKIHALIIFFGYVWSIKITPMVSWWLGSLAAGLSAIHSCSVPFMAFFQIAKPCSRINTHIHKF